MSLIPTIPLKIMYGTYQRDSCIKEIKVRLVMGAYAGAASTLRRYSLGLRLPITQADARTAMTVTFIYDSN